MSGTQFDQIRLCNCCAMVKPIEEFRRRRRHSTLRFRQCNACHATAEHLRRKLRKAVDRQQRMRTLADRARVAESASQLQAFVQGAVASAGGLEQLLRDWHAALHDLREAKRGAPRLITFYEATIRMATVYAETTRSAVTGQSDDALRSLIKQACLQVAKENPRLLLEAAREAGWTITRPDTNRWSQGGEAQASA